MENWSPWQETLEYVFCPTVDDVLERLILNYDTDAAAQEIREAFEFIATQRAERRKEIEEIVRLELE